MLEEALAVVEAGLAGGKVKDKLAALEQQVRGCLHGSASQLGRRMLGEGCTRGTLAFCAWQASCAL